MIAAPGRAPRMLRIQGIMKAAVTAPTIVPASPDQRMARTTMVLLMVLQAIRSLHRPARVPRTSILRGTVVTRMGMERAGFRRNAVDYVLHSGSAAITTNRRFTARADPCFLRSFWLFPCCIMRSWSHERCIFVMSADFHDSTLEFLHYMLRWYIQTHILGASGLPFPPISYDPNDINDGIVGTTMSGPGSDTRCRI